MTRPSKRRSRRAATTRPSGGGGLLSNPQNSSTAAQYPVENASQKLDLNKQQAAGMIAANPQWANNPDLQQIINNGFLDKGKRAAVGFLDKTGIGTALRVIDTPRRVIQLAWRDIRHFDDELGTNIEPQHYLDVILGHDAKLREELGPELVGEHGDLSMSSLLSLYGWKPTPNFASSVIRFGAAFGGDVLTDPVSYVTAGASGLGKKAILSSATAVLDDAARATLGRVARRLDDLGETALEASMRRSVVDIVEGEAGLFERMWDDAIKNMPENAGLAVDFEALEATIRAEAREIAMFGKAKSGATARNFGLEDSVLAQWHRKVTTPLGSRDFGKLPAEYLSHAGVRNLEQAGQLGVAARASIDPFTTGGLRFGVPFIPSTKLVSAFSTMPLGATRGLGRKLTTPIRLAVNKIATTTKLGRWAKQQGTKLLDQTDINRGMFRAAREGKLYQFVQLDDITREVLRRGAFREHAAKLTVNLAALRHAAIDMDPAEFKELLQLAWNGANVEGLIPTERLAKYSPEIREAFSQFVADKHVALNAAHEFIGEALGLRIGFMDNYTPQVVTREYAANVKSYVDNALIPNIDPSDADGLLRTAQLLDVSVEDLIVFAEVTQGMSSRLRHAATVGDSKYYKRHNLGRTAVQMGESDVTFINGQSVALGQASGNIEKIDAALMRVHDAINKRNGGAVALNKDRLDVVDGVRVPLRAFEDNPALAMSRYLEDIQAAALELTVINEARKAGLIFDARFGEVIDKTLHEIAPTFEATEEIIRRIVTGRENVIEAIENATIKMDDHVLGGGLTVRAPAGAMSRKSYRKSVDRFRKEVAKIEAHQVDVRAAQAKLVKRLVDEHNLPEGEARKWAAATAQTMVTFRAESREMAEQFAEEIFVAVRESIDRADRGARHAARNKLDEIDARVARMVEAADEGFEELEEAFNVKMVGEAESVASRDLHVINEQGVIDPVATQLRMQALVDEVIAPNLVRQRAAVVNTLTQDIEEILTEAAELGAEEFLDKARRSKLVFLQARLHAIEEGAVESSSILGAIGVVDSDMAKSLLDDLGDDLVRGLEITGSRKRLYTLEMLASVSDNPSLMHEFWTDEWVRDVLAGGMLDRHPSIIANSVDGKITRAALRDAAVDRFQDRYASRLDQLANKLESLQKARAHSSIESVGLRALRDGNYVEAAQQANIISETIRTATGWKGRLSITQVAVGKNKGSWRISWLNDLDAELPSIREQVTALRSGTLDEAALHGRGIEEVLWWRDLEDSLTAAVESDALLVARRNVDELMDPKFRSSALDAWESLAPKLDSALTGRKGGVARLASAVRSPSGRWSREWLALERALPQHQIDKLRDTVHRLIISDENVFGVDKALLKWNDLEWNAKAFRPVEEAAGALERTAGELAQRAKTAEIAEHKQAIAIAQELTATLGAVARRAAEVDVNKVVKGVPARAAVMDEAFRKDLSHAAALANQLGIDGVAKTAKKRYGVRPSDLGMTSAEITRIAALGQVPERSLVRGFREGFVPAESFGLSGTFLNDVDLDPIIGMQLENMVNNLRALYTPLGVEMVSEVANGVLQMWKTSATVARPSFHWRNTISAIWNGMIAGTTMDSYRKSFGIGKWRDAMNAGRSIDEALELIPDLNTRAAVRAAHEVGVLDSGFGASEFKRVPGLRATMSGKEKARAAATPWSKDFLPALAGGRMMTRIEDYMRLATFMSWFDATNPSSGRLAKAMVDAVHFDYANLTNLERRVKKYIPFFIWTRRNIPLQLQVMLERPGLLNRYSHLMTGVRDNFNAGAEEFDDFPTNPYLSTVSAGTNVVFNADTPFWARLIMDPDLPTTDLERLPIFSTDKGFAGVFSLTEWVNFGAEMIGPQFSTPMNLNQQSEYNDVNAPVGFNQIFGALDAIDFWGLIDKSADGDVQIPYTARALFETVFPFWSEYTAGFENRPDAMARLGMTQDPSLADRGRAFALRQARGFGASLQIPGDTKSAAFNASDVMRDMKRREAKGLNEDGTEWIKELLGR